MHVLHAEMVEVGVSGQMASLKPEAGWGHINSYHYDACNLALAMS